MEASVSQADGRHVVREEADLLDRSQKGDREAYGVIVERYQLRVYNLVLRMTGNPATAEELAQEAFLRAYENIRRFDTGRSFLPWIMCIAANLARNHLKSARQREMPQAADDGFGDGGAPAEEDRMADRDRLARVERALMTLPLKYRLPLLLKHVEGMSYKEIKQATGLPVRVLKMRVHRARKRLRAAVASLDRERKERTRE